MPAQDAHDSPPPGGRAAGEGLSLWAGWARYCARAAHQAAEPASGHRPADRLAPRATRRRRAKRSLRSLPRRGRGARGDGRWAALRDGASESSGEGPPGADHHSPQGGQGGESNLQVGATQARTARGSSHDGGIWGREALARALPGRPWPNLRGDGLAVSRARDRAEHFSFRGAGKGHGAPCWPASPVGEVRTDRAPWASASGPQVAIWSPGARFRRGGPGASEYAGGSSRRRAGGPAHASGRGPRPVVGVGPPGRGYVQRKRLGGAHPRAQGWLLLGGFQSASRNRACCWWCWSTVWGQVLTCAGSTGRNKSRPDPIPSILTAP